MLKFEVKSRFTGTLQFVAEIDATEGTGFYIKLGLAVKWALKHGANLGGANLGGADLRGANLGGADLGGALLKGEKVKARIASAERIEAPYAFHLFEMEEGPAKILAGCRFFTMAEYREHVAVAYPKTTKAAETLRILDYFDACLKARKLALAAEKRAATVAAKRKAAA